MFHHSFTHDGHQFGVNLSYFFTYTAAMWCGVLGAPMLRRTCRSSISFCCSRPSTWLKPFQDLAPSVLQLGAMPSWYLWELENTKISCCRRCEVLESHHWSVEHGASLTAISSSMVCTLCSCACGRATQLCSPRSVQFSGLVSLVQPTAIPWLKVQASRLRATWMAPLSRSASISNLVRHEAPGNRHGNPTVRESEKILKKWSSNLGASKYQSSPFL